MPQFALLDDLPSVDGGDTDDDDTDDDSDEDGEPPHPVGFGSPWGKSWISLDPPSRAACSRGRSTYALRLDDDGFGDWSDQDEEEDVVTTKASGPARGRTGGGGGGFHPLVQAYPPLSSYIRADLASTAALLRPPPRRPGRQPQWRPRTGRDGAEQRREDDDLNYSDDEDDEAADEDLDGGENDVAVLFERLRRRLDSDSSALAVSFEREPVVATTAATPSPEAGIQRRIQAERRRVEEECRRHTELLSELVLESEQAAEAILQKRRAEEDRLREERDRQLEQERRVQEAQATREAKERRDGDERKAQEGLRQEKERAARERRAQEAQAQAGRATEHIDKAKKLVGQLVQVRASIEPFEQNKAVAKRRLEMKKVARGKVNTLSENAQKITEVAGEVAQAIAVAREVDEQIKHGLQRGDPGLTPDMARGKRYLADLLASVSMQRVQAESFNGPRGDGFPLAAMLSLVTAEHKDLAPIMAAHVYTVCPTAIPTLPAPRPDATEDDVMTSLGMLRDQKTGEFESFPRFLSRTESIVAFMADAQASQPISHHMMGGNQGAVLWLTRFLDLLPPAPTAPLPLITAPVLTAFLSGAGHMLANMHADEFRPCLDVITKDLVHRLDEGEIGQPFSIRLNKLLEGGFDFFLTNLPSKAIPELYYGASPASHKHVDTVSFGGTIGEQEGGGGSNRGRTAGGGASAAGHNPFGGGGSNATTFGSSQSVPNPNPPNPFGGGSISTGASSTGASAAVSSSPFGVGGSSSASFGASGSGFGAGSGGNSMIGRQQQKDMQQTFGSSSMTAGGTTTNSSPFGGGGGAAPSPSPFGTQQQPPSSSFGMPSTGFGSAPLANPSPFGSALAASPSPFGGGPSAPSANPSPFGGSMAAPSPSPFGGGITSPAQSQSPFGGGFSTASTQSQSPFGGGFSSAAAAPAGGMNASPFGGPTGDTRPTGFGSNSSASPFGNPASSPSPFGNAAPSPSPFGTGSAFGDGNNQLQQTGFGSSNISSFGGGRGAGQTADKAPCKFFAQGRCKFGDNCKFSHDAGAVSGSSSSFGGGGGFGSTSNNFNSNSPFGKPRR